MQYDDVLNQALSLSKLELIVVDLPQKETFKSAIGVRQSRRAMLVKWTDHAGDYGFGECSCRPDPYYSSEFLDGAITVVQRFLFPAIKEAKTYGDFLDCRKKVRGWPFTKAALEFAINDLFLRKGQKDLLSTWPYEQTNNVPVGISLGIQDNFEQLQAKAQAAVKFGYSRLKFKINPQSNANDFIKLKKQYPDLHLSFDANGSFYEQHFGQLKAYAPLYAMIEQPFPPSRLDIAQKGKAALPNLFVCLDESIKTISDLKIAQHLGIMNELNLKPGRVGGLLNSMKMLDYCYQQKIPCWIGGMFETGIGRTLNLRVAACLPHAKAHDLSPSHRYFEEDIIASPIQMTKDGKVQADKLHTPDIDFDTLDKHTIKKIVLTNE